MRAFRLERLGLVRANPIDGPERAKIYLPEFFLSGAGLAVANIPHSGCTVFTPVTARQPSLIALGERFKALEVGVSTLR